MATDITIANEAIGMIGKGTITALDEGSVEADEAAFHLPLVLDEMAEWTEWPELKVKVALAVATNDRPAEWLHAYAQPSDMAAAISVRQVEEDATSLPIYGSQTLPVQDALPIRFLVEGGKVYTNVEDASLFYSKSTLVSSDLSGTMRRACAAELASRLALSVKRDPKLADNLSQKAWMLRGLAVADAQNRSPDIEDRYTSEAELARAGVIS